MEVTSDSLALFLLPDFFAAGEVFSLFVSEVAASSCALLDVTVLLKRLLQIQCFPQSPAAGDFTCYK